MNSNSIALTSMFVFVILAGAAPSQDSNPLSPPADRDPFVGVWKADGERSRPKLSKTELSYVRTITRIGEDIVLSSTGGVSKAKIREYRARCDGAFYRLPTGPLLSCTWVGQTRVEGETREPNLRNPFWTREVTSDGQTMTITEFRDKARTKQSRVLVLDRVQ
jgi:hypothetical protein